MRVALVLAAVILAGCSGPAPEADSSGEPVVVGTQRDRETRDETTGDLEGRVHDVVNASIEGARVDILGTDAFTRTDAQGRFQLTAAAGTYTLRVAADQFRAIETPIELLADKVVEVAIRMEYVDERMGEALAHQHDYWQGQDTYVLMDEEVEVHANRGGDQVVPGLGEANHLVLYANNGEKEGYEIYLPDGTPTHPSMVIPGTGRIDVTLSWDSSDVAADSMGVAYVSADTNDLEVLEAGPSGHTHAIDVTPDMADSGHQLWTLWRFYVWLDNQPAQAADWEPTVMNGPIHVKMVLHRSDDPPLEPGHRDFWRGNDSLVLMDDDVVHRDGNQCCRVKNSFSFAIHLPDDVLVPPGTTRLEFHFTWRYTQEAPVLDKEHAVRWRAGDQDPTKTGYEDLHTAQPVQEEDHLKVYEFDVAPGQADAFYQPKSNWLWLPYQVGEEDVPNHVEKSAREYTLKVVAHR